MILAISSPKNCKKKKQKKFATSFQNIVISPLKNATLGGFFFVAEKCVETDIPPP